MSQEETYRDFLSRESFNVRDVAALLSNGEDRDFVDKKAQRLHEKDLIVYSNKELTKETLRTVLLSFTEGRGKLRDPERLDRLKGLINVAGWDVYGTAKPLEEDKTVKPKKLNGHKRTVRKKRTPKIETVEPANEGLKGSFFNSDTFLLIVALLLIGVQSSHFALYYIKSTGAHNFGNAITTIYGVISGLLIESVAFILISRGRGKFWLIVIALISFTINFLLNETYSKTGWDILGGLLLNALFPFCIYSFSELYFDEKK